jgi:serine/threonine-protein kinase
MDRNSDLVFAVFALQMRVINERQFTDCGLLWAEHPDARLADLLEEKGYIEKKAREAIETLVTEHVAKHGGDAGQSLAGLDLEKDLHDSLLSLPLPHETVELLEEDAVGETTPDLPDHPRGADRYVLGTEIGRGGLGRIVSARDRVLGRKVAVKEMMTHTEDATLLGRFLREGEIAGRLSHPHIIPVHDIGIRLEKGSRRPYFVMTEIEGRDLRDILGAVEKGEGTIRREFSRHRLLRIFQDVCLAVAYAHDQGVIHRDLKPANVMVGNYGEVYVVDWGLAKVHGQEDEILVDRKIPDGRPDTSATQLTLDGQIIGTPAYMPPEQAEGKIAEVDFLSDIYSLGAILYEILTLRPPYEGATLINVIATVLKGDLVPPSARVDAVREKLARGREDSPLAFPPPILPELEEICLRAMAQDKGNRFATVVDLHDEIQRFLEGQKEMERRQKAGRERVTRGKDHLTRYRQLREDIEKKRAEVAALDKQVKPWWPAEKKRELWAAQDEVKALMKERVTDFSAAEVAFDEAILQDPDNPEGLEGKCTLYYERYMAAEERRNGEETALYRSLLERYDRSRSWIRRIDRPGTLSLRTLACESACLSPVAEGRLEVRFGDEATVPWRGGRPLPEEAVREKDTSVPEIRMSLGAGSFFPRFGHADECKPAEVKGVEVTLHRYEEVDRRLVPGEGRPLGTTPLEKVELPQGSYLCVLRHTDYADIRLPVRIDRAGEWIQEVNLYREALIPPGFCHVPGGPFLFGGDAPRKLNLEERSACDFFLQQGQVTFADYIAFLAFLRARDPEEARKRQPRESNIRFLVEEESGWRLPRPDEENHHGFTPDVPVLGVSWFDALAFCAWYTWRHGRLFTLPHEYEWGKAARGVDGRLFPWGDTYDYSFSNTVGSHEEEPRLYPPGSFPADTSPYGVWDMAGNMSTWALDAPGLRFADNRLLCGGAWYFGEDRARSSARMGLEPSVAHRHTGIRLILRPVHLPS